MSVTSEEKVLSKLENSKAYREAYVNEHVKTSVPLQIRHLREQLELTQTQLAEQAKTTQTVISRLEDPNYGNLTLNSLLRIAAALDIGLLVKFVPFSRLLLEFQELSPQALSATSFTEELPILRAWAVNAKNTTLQLGYENKIAVLTTSHSPAPTSDLTEAEHYTHMQMQLLKRKPPKAVTVSTATVITAMDVSNLQEVVRHAISGSSMTRTSGGKSTVNLTGLSQGRTWRNLPTQQITAMEKRNTQQMPLQ